MRQRQEPAKNLRLGVKFIVLIVFLIFISVSFKVVDIIRNSTFDGKSNFYILKNTDDGLEDVTISPITNSVTILDYKTSDKSFSNSALPYNLFSTDTSTLDKDNFKSQFIKVLKSSSPNPMDFVRLVILEFQISDVKKIEMDSSDPNTLKDISQSISDPKISEENLTIEVVNATGVSGVGNIFARMIGYMGGNVILVSTDEKISDKSKIVTLSKNSLTVNSLKKMLHLVQDNSKPGVSDVKIIIGKDLLNRI